MSAVFAPFGEHDVFAIVFDDHDIFDPFVLDKRVFRMSRPGDAVFGSGVAEHTLAVLRAVIAGVPEFPLIAFAQDPAALADFGVPLALGRREYRISLIGRKLY